MSRKRQDIDIDRAIELFKGCESWRGVAREMGVHPYLIQTRLQPLGYVAKEWKGQALTWNLKEAIRLRTKEGKTFKEIGELFGVTASAIQRVMGKKYKRSKK